jgi:hypothetical protein
LTGSLRCLIEYISDFRHSLTQGIGNMNMTATDWLRRVACGYLDTGHASFSCTLACCASEIALFVLSVLLTLSGNRRPSLELLPKLHSMPAAKPSITQSSGVVQRVRAIPAQ